MVDRVHRAFRKMKAGTVGGQSRIATPAASGFRVVRRLVPSEPGLVWPDDFDQVDFADADTVSFYSFQGDMSYSVGDAISCFLVTRANHTDQPTVTDGVPPFAETLSETVGSPSPYEFAFQYDTVDVDTTNGMTWEWGSNVVEATTGSIAVRRNGLTIGLTDSGLVGASSVGLTVGSPNSLVTIIWVVSEFGVTLSGEVYFALVNRVFPEFSLGPGYLNGLIILGSGPHIITLDGGGSDIRFYSWLELT